jgi:hypothetical protein
VGFLNKENKKSGRRHGGSFGLEREGKRRLKKG